MGLKRLMASALRVIRKPTRRCRSVVFAQYSRAQFFGARFAFGRVEVVVWFEGVASVAKVATCLIVSPVCCSLGLVVSFCLRELPPALMFGLVRIAVDFSEHFLFGFLAWFSCFLRFDFVWISVAISSVCFV